MQFRNSSPVLREHALAQYRCPPLPEGWGESLTNLHPTHPGAHPKIKAPSGALLYVPTKKCARMIDTVLEYFKLLARRRAVLPYRPDIIWVLRSDRRTIEIAIRALRDTHAIQVQVSEEGLRGSHPREWTVTLPGWHTLRSAGLPQKKDELW